MLLYDFFLTKTKNFSCYCFQNENKKSSKLLHLYKSGHNPCFTWMSYLIAIHSKKKAASPH